MTTWVAITDPATATGAIITQALMRAYRDNMRALAEDDASVPALDTIKRLGRQNRVIVGTLADDTLAKLQVQDLMRSYSQVNAGSSSESVAGLQVGNTNAAGKYFHAGYDPINDRAFIAGLHSGVAWKDLAICPVSGSVIVGTDPGGSSKVRVGGNIRIGGSTNTYPWEVQCSGGADEFYIRSETAGANRLTINSSGAVDASAFGTTGTFTPSLVGTTGGSAHTYSARSGWYRKVGKLVFFFVRIALSAKDGTMGGTITLSGLPFAANNIGVWYPLTVGYWAGLTLTASYYQTTAMIAPAASAINVYEKGSSAIQSIPAANFGAGTTDLYISGTYETT